MELSIWLPVDFFLGVGGNRRRLLDVPLVTEERTGPRHRVVEVSWDFLLSWTLIIDLKRVFIPTPVSSTAIRIQTGDTCQPVRIAARMKRRRTQDFDEAV